MKLVNLILVLSFLTFANLALGQTVLQCTGCDEQPSGTNDLEAEIEYWESTPDGEELLCTFYAYAALTTFSKECEGSPPCSGKSCTQKWAIAIRSDGSNCSGMRMNLVEQQDNGPRSLLTEDTYDAGNYELPDPTTITGPEGGQFATVASCGKQTKHEVLLNGVDPGHPRYVEDDDNKIVIRLKCGPCAAPTPPPPPF